MHTLAGTHDCLAGRDGLRLSSKVDFVASNALGGAVFVRLDGRNAVTISFGLDEQEARRIATAYRRVRGRNIGIADVLRPDHNAVLLWRAHPDPEDEETIKDCLK